MAKQKEKLPTTTVGELIAKLLQMDQNAPVELKIGSPQDSAYTHAELEVEFDKEYGEVVVSGYVSSDDEDAFFPGMDNFDE